MSRRAALVFSAILAWAVGGGVMAQTTTTQAPDATAPAPVGAPPAKPDPLAAYYHSPKHLIQPLHPPPPAADPNANATLDRSNDIDKHRLGVQWCRLIDPDSGTVYFSKVFPGVAPSEKAFHDYIARTYSIDSQNFLCVVDNWGADFAEQDAERRNEFYYQLQNQKVVETPWQP